MGLGFFENFCGGLKGISISHLGGYGGAIQRHHWGQPPQNSPFVVTFNPFVVIFLGCFYYICKGIKKYKTHKYIKH